MAALYGRSDVVSLHNAAFDGRLDVVSLLVARGANVEAVTKVRSLSFMTCGAVPVVCCNRVYLTSIIRYAPHQYNAVIAKFSKHAVLSQVRPAACLAMGVDVLLSSVFLVKLGVYYFL